MSGQMLLPEIVVDVKTTICYDLIYYNGRCYCQDVIVVDVITTVSTCYEADVIAYVADGIATTGWVYLWQMLMPCGRWNGHRSVYFNFSSEVLNRTSSHMCCRWYLPMFLLRDGLFTLMYKASLIVVIRFWSFLPTMLKFSIVTLWPVML